jgi:hypothetical protein
MNKLQKLSLVLSGFLLGMLLEYCIKTPIEHLKEVYYIPVYLILITLFNIFVKISTDKYESTIFPL